jgi:PAS domain S-box-containing protein
MSDEVLASAGWREVGAASIDGVGVFDGDEYVYANQAFADIYGYDDPDELVGTAWQERHERDERERIEREVLPRVREEGSWRGESVGRRRDGEILSLKLSLRATEDGIVCVVRDVTERAARERKLREERRLLQTAIDAVDDILYVFDEDGDPYLWNEALTETTGYTDAEIDTIESERFLPEEQREYVPGLAEAIDALGDRQVDLDIVTKDGERIPHEFRGTTFEDPETGRTYRCGLARDVTDRVERERELRRQRALIEGVLNAAPDIIYAFDEDGTQVLNDTLVNPAIGYSEAEIKSTHPLAFIAEEDRPEIEAAIATLLDEGTVESREAALVTKDGERVPYEFSAGPFAEDGEMLGIVGVGRDITERVERERALQRERDRLNLLFENLPTPTMYGVTSADGPTVRAVNSAFEDVFGCEAEDIEEMDLDELIVPADADNDALNRRVVGEGSVEAEVRRDAADGVRDFHLQTAVAPLDDSEEDASFEGWGIYTDITERKRRERALERQRDELETLDRINDLLFEIARELFGTPTREGIERAVCERLADSELYEFAWIGEPEPGGDRLAVRTSAGVDDGYVEAVTITADETETGRGPGGRALRTGEVQVSQDVGTDPTFEHWREEALDRGIRSAAAVPLVHEGATYGVLAVYATRPLAFSRREQAAFAGLGEAVGFAIHAINNRWLLFADAVLELEFQFVDADQFLVGHSARFGCELSVEGYVATKSGGWLLYVAVEGASPDALCEAAAELDGLEHVRVVRGAANDSLLEYRFEESALLGTLAEVGVKLRSAEATDGSGRFVVEAPQDAGVRELVGRVREVYPTAELLAQRERDRSVAEVAVPGGPLERLTDRQREALETAYRAGYFDWPRESTATEVAESMGIAAPTLHRHFRRAEKRLLSAFFDPTENIPEWRR